MGKRQNKREQKKRVQFQGSGFIQKKKSSGSDSSPIDVLSSGTMHPYAMDGTSIPEISIMKNEKYAPQIVQKVQKVFDLKKLQAMKLKNQSKYLSEGSHQIIELSRAIESINTHTRMFVVHFLVQIGTILQDVEATLKSRPTFSQWIRDNFEDNHKRYFQQAKQLAGMGPSALNYASAGKKRLLELDRLRKAENKSTIAENKSTIDEVINSHALPDTTKDMNGNLLREHIDAIVTMSRLKNAGIDFVDYDQAYLIGAYEHQAIEIKTAEKVKIWLDAFKTDDQKKKQFDMLVMNKMFFPSSRSYQAVGNRQSLNKIFTDLISNIGEIDFKNNEWSKRIDINIFKGALESIEILSSNLKNISSGSGDKQ